MERPDRPRAVNITALIVGLRRNVEGLVDSDRVLPADGALLLATLDRALSSLNGKEAAAAIECFLGQIDTLTEAGVLEAADGHRQIAVAAAAMRELLARANAAVPGRR